MICQSAEFYQNINRKAQMSVTTDQLIQHTLKKLVLKCEVKPPLASTFAESKVTQRVTLLPIPSAPINKLCNKSLNNQLQQSAASAIIRGNVQYNRKSYANALKQYRHSLEMYQQLKSIKYYKILQLMVNCQKKLKHYKEAKKLYEEISLIYIGQQ